MGTKVKDSGGGDFTPAPAGIHRAVCIAYIDLGMQEGRDYHDQSKTVVKPQVVIMWEIPDETIEIDGEIKPQTIRKFYTKTIGEKSNLGKDLESWRGKKFTTEEREGFDLDKILGISCQINVVHETKGNKTRAKVTAVMPLGKGMEKLTPSIIPWRYDIIEDGEEFPPELTDGFRKMILNSAEMTGSTESDTEDTEDTEDPEYGPDDNPENLPF